MRYTEAKQQFASHIPDLLERYTEAKQQFANHMSQVACGEVISTNGWPPTSHREHQEEKAQPLDKCVIRGSGPVVGAASPTSPKSTEERLDSNQLVE